VNVVICEYSSLPILAAENEARVQAAHTAVCLFRSGQEVEPIPWPSKGRDVILLVEGGGAKKVRVGGAAEDLTQQESHLSVQAGNPCYVVHKL